MSVVHDGVGGDVRGGDLVDAAGAVARVGEDVELRRVIGKGAERALESMEERHGVDERLVGELERDAAERRLDACVGAGEEDEVVCGACYAVHVLDGLVRVCGSGVHGVRVELDLVLDHGGVRRAEGGRHGWR